MIRIPSFVKLLKAWTLFALAYIRKCASSAVFYLKQAYLKQWAAGLAAAAVLHTRPQKGHWRQSDLILPLESAQLKPHVSSSLPRLHPECSRINLVILFVVVVVVVVVWSNHYFIFGGYSDIYNTNNKTLRCYIAWKTAIRCVFSSLLRSASAYWRRYTSSSAANAHAQILSFSRAASTAKAACLLSESS